MVGRLCLKQSFILLVLTSIVGFLVQDMFYSFILLVLTCIVGFLVQDMFYEYFDQHSMNFSHMKHFENISKSVHSGKQWRLETRRIDLLELEGKHDGTFETNESSSSNLTIAPTPLPIDVRHEWPESNKKALKYFMLSAIGHNVTAVYGYKWEIKLNGWRAVNHSLVTIKCCISWNNNMITEFISPNMTTRERQLSIAATSITCPIKGPFEDVKGVTLEFAQSKCPTDESSYTKPFIPRQQSKRHSFAVCLKLLYGNVNTKLLIDWMEFYREIKVDKIFMFVYNITQETQFIIKRYVSLGLLETRQFEFPWKTGDPVGMKTSRFWQDEQVVVYDCFHRLYGYNYVAIIDLDEFLLPRKYDNIKDTMAYLMNTYPKAAGYTLKSFIFNKAWGTSGQANGSDIVQYIQRTSALTGKKSRRKNILIPSRVLEDRHLFTHGFKPKPGYERFRSLLDF